MAPPKVTHKSADGISLGIMLIGIGVISYLSAWWPGILLVIGISLAVKQYLRGRYYDLAMTTLIFGGLFLFFYFDINWSVVMPVLLVLGGIYLIFREYFVSKERYGVDRVEDESQEIEDAAKDDK